MLIELDWLATQLDHPKEASETMAKEKRKLPRIKNLFIDNLWLETFFFFCAIHVILL